MADLSEKYDHPAWTTVVSTGAGYLLVLALLFVLLFVLPYLIFSVL